MPGGRPRLIKSPQEFERRAKEYFRKAEEAGTPLTVTGLALAVGLSSRDSLDEYGRREEFSDSVKKAKLRVENGYEMRLAGGASPVGAIFALKNFGWRDKQDVGVDGEVKIRIERNWE